MVNLMFKITGGHHNCMINISKYKKAHEVELISLLKEEADWDYFTNNDAIGNFRKSLSNSISLVCYFDGFLCGYVRAIDDPFGIYVSELYVSPSFRNKGCGRELLNSLKSRYSEREMYVFSDEDEYYEKLGLTKVGSIFQL